MKRTNMWTPAHILSTSTRFTLATNIEVYAIQLAFFQQSKHPYSGVQKRRRGSSWELCVPLELLSVRHPHVVRYDPEYSNRPDFVSVKLRNMNNETSAFRNGLFLFLNNWFPFKRIDGVSTLLVFGTYKTSDWNDRTVCTRCCELHKILNFIIVLFRVF